MADNRIYLTCAICGSKLGIGKSHYEGAYYSGDNLEEALNKFYDDHTFHFDPDIDIKDGTNLLGVCFYIEHERFSDAHNEAIRKLYLTGGDHGRGQ